jgi:hypothetical protein
MGSIIYRAPMDVCADHGDAPLDYGETRVSVPFQRPVSVQLPDDDGRAQFSIRDDGGYVVEMSEHEHFGWTVEYRALESGERIEFWITVTVTKAQWRDGGRGFCSAPTHALIERPAINMMLDEAVKAAKEVRDQAALAQRQGNPFKMGIVRARHQASGHVIYADIL